MSTVAIAGAGPTGLMLACELRRAEINVELVDQKDQRSDRSRAAAMHARTMEVFDQRGMLDAFLAAGKPVDAAHFAGIPLDMSTLPTRYPYMLALMQTVTERVLEQFVADLGATVQWSTSVVGAQQDDDGVTVTLRRPTGEISCRADYLVGCDGGQSAVRRLAGLPFEGTDGTYITLLGDVELDDPPRGRVMLERRAAGNYTVLPFGSFSGDTWQRVMVTEYRASTESGPPSLDALRQSLLRVAGTDFGMHTPHWLSRFSDAARQASDYRSGRILVAGDAAHIHSPLGGQGMNLGIQDAVNLGWKLSAVVSEQTSERLLDTYNDERWPVAAAVLNNTRAQMSLLEPGENTEAMRSLMRILLQIPAANEVVAAHISGLDICYRGIGGHPLIGRRIPDADVLTAVGRQRIIDLLPVANPVLLDLRARPCPRLTCPLSVKHAVAQCPTRQWRLPVLGWVDVPQAVLVRPDGYVAWASSDGSDAGLADALAVWRG